MADIHGFCNAPFEKLTDVLSGTLDSGGDLGASVAVTVEFTQNGKDGVLVRHLMSHTSGVSGWEQPVTQEDIYAAGFDGTVFTWHSNPKSWAEFARAIAGRNLTRHEWSDAFGTRPYHDTCPATS